MVFSFGRDIYVLPAAVDLVQKGPPVATGVAQNADGTVTITGAGFGYDSRVFFDGLQAALGTFGGTDAQGTLTVAPPPGTSGQTAAVTVYNSDGQNSTILSSAAPPTYTYPGAGAPQILSISPNTLPAGAPPRVGNTAAEMKFVGGPVTSGFGSHAVLVLPAWGVGPPHPARE